MKVVSTASSHAALFACLGGCFSHHVTAEPIEVKPIHVIVDVNVTVQRELEQFFDFEEGVDPAAGKSEADAKQDPPPTRTKS